MKKEIEDLFRRAGLDYEQDETAAQMVSELQALIDRAVRERMTSWIKKESTIYLGLAFAKVIVSRGKEDFTKEEVKQAKDFLMKHKDKISHLTDSEK